MAPSQRREGWRVGTYSAPVELIAQAQAKAEGDGTDLSAIIRAALEQYVA